MTKPLQPMHFTFTINLRRPALLAMLGALVAFAFPSAQSQTYQVIHRFQAGDGAGPSAGLTVDAAGRLYGTTGAGGIFNFGTAFKLAPSGSGWTLTTLYSFAGDHDG